MHFNGAIRYLERLGDPFLFVEERTVTVSGGEPHVVINHLPKAVFVMEGTLRHGSPAAPEILKPGSVLINFQKRRNVYLPPAGARSGRIRVLRLTLPWDFQKRREPGDGDRFGTWLAENLPAYGIVHLAEGEQGGRRIHELRDCLTLRDAGCRYRANAVARLIFLELIKGGAAEAGTAGGAGGLLASVERFLENNLHRPLVLADVARAVDRSEEHLSRLFRAHRRATIFQELRRLRIKRAQYLLLCSELPVNRIAEQTGFATLAHFSRTFREDAGQSPSAYRARSGFRTEAESSTL